MVKPGKVNRLIRIRIPQGEGRILYFDEEKVIVELDNGKVLELDAQQDATLTMVRNH